MSRAFAARFSLRYSLARLVAARSCQAIVSWRRDQSSDSTKHLSASSERVRQPLPKHDLALDAKQLRLVPVLLVALGSRRALRQSPGDLPGPPDARQRIGKLAEKDAIIDAELDLAESVESFGRAWPGLRQAGRV